MKYAIYLASATLLITLTGCAAKQEISAFQKAPPKNICVARHEAVRENFHAALLEALESHKAETRTIQANYVAKHNTFEPSIVEQNIDSCDAIAFYTANWAWDITMYMYYANIWITDKNMSQKIAQASYQTGGGMDKWINAKEKINELVNEMYKQVKGQEPVNYVLKPLVNPEGQVSSQPDGFETAN